jgi:hypothetical protein
LGKIFSAVSEPFILNNCIPPTFSNGNIVIAITITPMPPNHCKRALQIRMPLGASSKFVIIVEPVVVIPDMLSKKESTNERFRSDNKKGKDPKIAILNQVKVVKRKAPCKFSFLSSCKFVRTRSTPINEVINAEEIKVLFFSLYINCTKNGINMNAPNIIRSIPIVKKTVL